MIGKPQLGTQNIIFDLYLVKFTDAKLADTKGKLPFFEKKKIRYKWTHAVQNHIIQRSTVVPPSRPKTYSNFTALLSMLSDKAILSLSII